LLLSYWDRVAWSTALQALEAALRCLMLRGLRRFQNK
jgi:hypothetical protein